MIVVNGLMKHSPNKKWILFLISRSDWLKPMVNRELFSLFFLLFLYPQQLIDIIFHRVLQFQYCRFTSNSHFSFEWVIRQKFLAHTENICTDNRIEHRKHTENHRRYLELMCFPINWNKTNQQQQRTNLRWVFFGLSFDCMNWLHLVWLTSIEELKKIFLLNEERKKCLLNNAIEKRPTKWHKSEKEVQRNLFRRKRVKKMHKLHQNKIDTWTMKQQCIELTVTNCCWKQVMVEHNSNQRLAK